MSNEVVEILNVAGELYESVLDETKWLPAMQSIQRFLGDHAGSRPLQ